MCLLFLFSEISHFIAECCVAAAWRRLGQQEDSFEFRVILGRVFQGDRGISFIRNLMEQSIPAVLFLEIPI